MADFSVKNYSHVSCRQMFGSFCQFIQDVVTCKRSGCGYFRKCGRCGFCDLTSDTRQRGECVCPACSSLLRQQRGYSSSRRNDFCCIWVTTCSGVSPSPLVCCHSGEHPTRCPAHGLLMPLQRERGAQRSGEG